MKKLISIISLLFMLLACVSGMAQTEADVVVVGGGTAGLSAAIEAAQAGSKVVLLEKQGALGGSTVMSGGAMFRNATEAEALEGNALKDDALVAFFMENANGNADEAMVRSIVERSTAANDFLLDAGHKRTTMFYEASNKIVMVEWGESGAQLIGALQQKAESLGVEIVTGTAATELVIKDGAVCGVKAVSGETETVYACNSVVIATGGYTLNKELIGEHTDLVSVLPIIGGMGNSGDGIAMAQAVNAKTAYKGGALNSAWMTRSSHVSTISTPYYITVNHAGNRVLNEHQFYSRVSNDMINAGEPNYYLIMNQATAPDGIEDGVADGSVAKADTIEALGAAIGIDGAALTATIERYNAMCAKGVDDDFGKEADFLKAIAEGPYYAVECYPMALGTFGGLCIDMNSQVLDVNDAPIANLYAAGEVANTDFFGEVYPVSGSCITHAVVTGRTAGQSAAANAQ